MKKIFTILLATASVSMSAQQLAFPGAEGFGRFATGGRGCEVYHVTNLNDSGAGSLRDAVSQPNRTVVFEVSGIIKLKSRLVFSKNLTIAGQTAPGNGVVVYGNGVTFSACDNIIVRHMRFRMGNSGTSGADAAGLANGKNMMFDHLSISWGLDENFSINWDNKGTEPSNITIQNSIIGQGILIHAMGGLMQTNGGVSILKNLYIDNKSRNPKVKGLNQFVNNVVYNWGSDGYILGGSAGNSWATIEDSYFIKGPESSSPFSRATATFQVYQNGNKYDNTLDGVLNGKDVVNSDMGPATFVSSYDGFNGAPQRHPDITDRLTADQSVEHIIKSGGACLPVRDEVDAFMIDELVSYGLKGRQITGEHENGIVNNVGLYYNVEAYVDTDRDGIPDFWEDANGLDKNNKADGKIIREDGYSNLEHYLNGITSGKPFLKYPTNMSVSGLTTNSFGLSWINREPQAHTIIIERSIDNVNFTEAGRVESTQSYFEFTDLTEKTKYYIRMKTLTPDMQSCYSDVYTVNTLGTLGAPVPSIAVYPQNEAITKDYNSIELSWKNTTGVSAGWLYFTVYMGTSPENMERILEESKTPKVTVDVKENTTYYWRVDCKNAMGEEAGELWSFTTGQEPVRTKVLYYSLDQTEGTDIYNGFEGAEAALASYFTPSFEKGVFNNCISFAGTPASQRIVQSSYEEIEIGESSFTVELWFKSAPATSVDWYFYHKGSHTKNSGTGATGRWNGLQYKNSKMYFGVDDDVTKSTAEFTASSLFDNQWHHLVCIRDTENKKLYIYADGVLKATGTDATANTIASAEDLVFGNCNVNFNTPFKGSIDEFAIYNDVLSETEIISKYQDGQKSLTSVSQVVKAHDINVYPNPFRNKVQIEGTATGHNDLYLYNTAGVQVLYRSFENNGAEICELDVTGMSPGIYTLVIKNGDAITTKRLIKNLR